MSSYIRQFRSYLRKNETARGLFLVGVVILGAIAVWGGIRLALSTEYPILVVSSGSMCQRLNPALRTNACTLENRVIKIYPPSSSTYGQYTFWTEGDANGVQDGWDQPNGGIPGSQVVGVYQATIPIPYLGAAILDIRGFMYDDATGQPKTQGILVIVALIVALFAFEVAEPGKNKPSSKFPEEKEGFGRADHSLAFTA